MVDHFNKKSIIGIAVVKNVYRLENNKKRYEEIYAKIMCEDRRNRSKIFLSRYKTWICRIIEPFFLEIKLVLETANVMFVEKILRHHLSLAAKHLYKQIQILEYSKVGNDLCVSPGKTKFNGSEIDILLLVGFRTPRTSQDLLQSSIALSSLPFLSSSLQWIP